MKNIAIKIYIVRYHFKNYLICLCIFFMSWGSSWVVIIFFLSPSIIWYIIILLFRRSFQLICLTYIYGILLIWDNTDILNQISQPKVSKVFVKYSNIYKINRLVNVRWSIYIVIFFPIIFLVYCTDTVIYVHLATYLFFKTLLHQPATIRWQRWQQ